MARKNAEETPEKPASVSKTRTRAKSTAIQSREKSNQTPKKRSGVSVSGTQDAKGVSNRKKQADSGNSIATDYGDYSHFPIRKRLYIEAYCNNGGNQYRAAITAGYTPSTAKSFATALHKELGPYCEHIINNHLEAIAMSRDKVLREIELMAQADPNELVEVRTVCCRYCWGGPEFRYMETPSELRDRTREYDAQCERAEAAGKEPPVWDDSRILGFKGTREPNPECPECWGEGTEYVKLKDTRLLSPAARAIYAGAKHGKFGIEVNMHSKEKAAEMLAKHHKIYEDKVAGTVAFDTETLEEMFGRKMREAHERMTDVRKRRGLDKE